MGPPRENFADKTALNGGALDDMQEGMMTRLFKSMIVTTKPSLSGSVAKLGRAAVVVALAAGLVAGCGGTQAGRGLQTAFSATPANLPADEAALVDQSRQIVQRSIFQGAAIGAGIGCVGGLLIGGGLTDCLVGAAVGGVAGGVAGAAVGQGNADAAARLDEEEKFIAELEADRARLDAFETQLEAKIAQQNAELARLNDQIAANQITAAAYSERYRQIRFVRNRVAENLDAEAQQRREDLAQIQQAKAQGVDVSRVETPLNDNLSRLARLSQASRDLAPPAVPVQDI